MKHFIVTIFGLLCVGCFNSPSTQFTLLDSKDTGIRFNNAIVESDTLNILSNEYIFNGGGVAVADFDKNGLPDLFFTGNQVENALYLNQGNLKFKGVTLASGVGGGNKWSTGVAVADVNLDGWTDIYVCAAMIEGERDNMLFINQGLNEEGTPYFIDKAEAYGLADSANSMNATFMDYDKDGDLDLYVLNNEQNKTLASNYREKVTDGTAISNDHLFRNNSDGTFTNVTLAAGITIEGFGLGIAVSDLNQDSYPDIYVANDFTSNDILYINNQDGTFTNRIADYVKHQSLFSMGIDIADFNNDGFQDIVTLDMLGETNFRKKTTISESNPRVVFFNEKWGYEPQHSRNMLHLGGGSNKMFSEIGMLSGIYQTDWSWSPLFFDADNDGRKDLFVTNGFPRDITDKDFSDYRQAVGRYTKAKYLLDSIPIIKQPNYAFKNKEDLSFTDESASWGIDIPSFSNGAAYVDLDQDGDLDYVVNNINDEAFVFENQQQQKDTKNYLQLNLIGQKENPTGLGVKVLVTFGGDSKILFHEHYQSRGYLSSVDNVIHFGLGEEDKISAVTVIWPDGHSQKIVDVEANQRLDIRYSDAEEKKTVLAPNHKEESVVKFEEVSSALEVTFDHTKVDEPDFYIQRLLPRKISEESPVMVSGDLNNDGLQDIIVTDARGKAPVIFLQEEGSFKRSEALNAYVNKLTQVADVGLMDFDQDGDLDVFLLANRVHFNKQIFEPSNSILLNDGNANFTIAEGFSFDNAKEGTFLRPYDFDNDGDLDVFIGGKTWVHKYPLSEASTLLRNDNGAFVNITQQFFGQTELPGIPKEAQWGDVSGDGLADLIILNEFQPIKILVNKKDRFEILSNTGLENYSGWWESVKLFDNDADGDMDFVVGNIGINNTYNISKETPVCLVFKDFDDNGAIDPILFSYAKDQTGALRQYPFTFWGNLNKQSPYFRKKFARYKEFASADIDQIFSKEELADATAWKLNYAKTSYVENLGNGKFKVHALPVEVQFAPVNDFEIGDFNEDGNLDLLVVGNDYKGEAFIGPYDAFSGLVLIGDGNHTFKPIEKYKSNFIVEGDAKDIEKVTLGNDGKEAYFVSQNSGVLLVYCKSVP